MISHQIEEVVLLSERVIVMKDKKIEGDYVIPFEYPRNIEDPLVVKKIIEIREAL
jgi:ABC-type nitrate/sulfonate/bicarbonate transport system ATPase subunit